MAFLAIFNQMQISIFIALPTVTALTAVLTARFVIYSILYPLTPKSIGGISAHGYLLANKGFIGSEIGKILPTLAEPIASQLSSSDLSQMTPVIEEHLDKYLRIRLKEKLPVIASFIGEQTVVKLKASMLEEIEHLLPIILSKYVQTTLKNGTVSSKIEATIAEINPNTIENIMGPLIKKALRKSTLIFGILGIIAGLVAATILHMLA